MTLPILVGPSTVTINRNDRVEFTNDGLIDDQGPVERHSMAIRLDRTISGGIHEDCDLINYGRRPVRLTIEFDFASDFADTFDVKSGA